MTQIDDDDLDRRLRAVVDPDTSAVERVVAGALRSSRRPVSWWSGIAVAASAVVVGLLVVVFVRPWPTAPDTLATLTLIDDVLVVDYPDGARSILGPERAADELFAGFDLILVSKETP